MSWEIANHIDRGIAADRPVAGAVPGKHYGWFATDTGVLSISDGSVWVEIGPFDDSTLTSGLSSHLADSSDAHDASAISVLDAGNNFTATDVEAALAELFAAISAGGVPTSRTLTAGAALTGGGDLSANRTFDVAVDGSTIEVSSDALRVKADGITANEIAAGAVGASELASTAVTPATYGDATHVGSFTVDADGRITAASDVSITGGGSGTPLDGWNSTVALTYSSADAPTFVATTASDLTGVIPVGARIRLVQTTTKYFIVTAIDATTITLYGGTDYTLANAAITSPYYALVKAPLGFPLSPAKWTVEVTDTSDRTQANPVQNTWYNLGSLTISLPIGSWRVYWEATGDAGRASSGNLNIFGTLSTANNSQNDAQMSTLAHITGVRLILPLRREKVINPAAKTSYFLNAKTNNTGEDFIDFRGDLAVTIVRAVSNYL